MKIIRNTNSSMNFNMCQIDIFILKFIDIMALIDEIFFMAYFLKTLLWFKIYTNEL